MRFHSLGQLASYAPFIAWGVIGLGGLVGGLAGGMIGLRATRVKEIR